MTCKESSSSKRLKKNAGGEADGSPRSDIRSCMPKAMSETRTDVRKRMYINACSVVWKQGAVENSESLLLDHSGQASVVEEFVPCVLGKKEGDYEDSSILIDFGTELFGGIEIVTGLVSGEDDASLHLRFGESVGETMQDHVHKHSTQNMDIRLPGNGSLEVGSTGFRFVRIDLKSDQKRMVEIKTVRAVMLYRDLEYKGSFNCSDELLNTIWRTGAYTTHLNLQKYIWDGIKRDQLVWAGDVHTAVMCASSVFGQDAPVPETLDYLRDTTPLPGFMNNFSAYSLWWIITHKDWYMSHGDLDYLNEQVDYLRGLLLHLTEFVDSDGRERLPATRFIDWSTAGNEEVVHAGLQALMIIAFQAGEFMFRECGSTKDAEFCRASLQTLRRHCPESDTKQAAALQALSGQRSFSDVNRLVLAKDPEKGISPFFGFYILSARAEAGDVAGCLDLIKNYWGGMVKLGATTFWESFDISWCENAARIDQIPQEGQIDPHGAYGEHCYKSYRHSLCHAWASGPTPWLARYVLGIKPMKAGCREIVIEPNLGGLKWAEGDFPTPYGNLYVRHEKRDDGTVTTCCESPKGVSVTVAKD